jgi:hypothetical protein
MMLIKDACRTDRTEYTSKQTTRGGPTHHHKITPIGSNTCSGYNQQVMEIEVLNILKFKSF